MPTRRREAAYAPLELVVTERLALVSRLRTVTVAPARGAPVVSLTVPRITPVEAWAWPASRDGIASSTRNDRTTGSAANALLTRMDISVSCGWVGCRPWPAIGGVRGALPYVLEGKFARRRVSGSAGQRIGGTTVHRSVGPTVHER